MHHYGRQTKPAALCTTQTSDTDTPGLALLPQLNPLAAHRQAMSAYSTAAGCVPDGAPLIEPASTCK